MDSSFNQPSSHVIMDEEDDDLDSVSSSSGVSISNSISSDSMEDVTSVSSSASSSSSGQLGSGPLYEMSSLLQQLPFKRGLSNHYQGKSQSFTSLSSVRCLEDLAKPENPHKKLKSCKSYGGLSESHRSYPTRKTLSRPISKKASKVSCSSLNAKRSNSFMSNRPPIPPHRSGSLSNQTPLFA